MLWAALLIPLVLAQETGTAQFPSPLTKENFKSKLSHGLHLVEFFSPYCSHCLQFAPTWERTWGTFHEEGDSLGIAMSQVDCVESGDLCGEEKITAYPSLKLYGPDGFIKNYPKAAKRKDEALIKFMRDSVAQLGDPEFHVSSRSVAISTDQMARLLGEAQTRPVLISFWPSYTLENLDEYNADKFDTRYDEDCLDIQRTWSIVSNQVVSLGVDTVHFNCLNNKRICKEIGFDLLKPHVALVLPDMRVAKLIVFDEELFELSVKDIVDFTSRTLHNARAPLVSMDELVQLTPAHMPYLSSFPTDPQTSFVFVYDDESVSHEDFELLPYLIEPLSKLSNAKLYRTNDTNALNLVDVQQKALYEHLNYNASEPERKFNEHRNTIETATSLPALVVFHDALQWSKVYQSFGPNEIRDQYRVIDWIRANSLPAYGQFNDATVPRFLFGNDVTDRVVLVLLDPSDEKENLRLQHNFLTGVYDYADLRDKARFEQIMSKRKMKQAKSELLKKKNAAAKDIVEELKREIHYENSGQIAVGWVDVKDSGILSRLGCNVNNRGYIAGDVIVIEMFEESYYERDTEGGTLNVRESPWFLRHLLTTIQGISTGRSLVQVRRHSMFGESFRWMDAVMSYVNVWTVLLIAVIVVALLKFARGRKNRDTRGILGIPEAKAD